MRETMIAIVMMAALSGTAHGEVLSLKGNTMMIDVETRDSRLAGITFTNTKSGAILHTDTLFVIKGLGDTLIPSSAFAIEEFSKEQNRISITFKSWDFVVKSAVSLDDQHAYSTLSWSLQALHDGRQIGSFSLLPFRAQAPFIYGSTNSSPIISDSFFIIPQNPLVNTRVVNIHDYEGSTTQTIPVPLPLEDGKPMSYTSYIGTFAAGQLRRDVNRFINVVRDRPYDPYLHYNSWFDIGFNNPYTEQDALTRIRQFGDQLITRRKVPMNGFLFDEGWDDFKGNWAFSKDFPNGFSTLKSTAEQYHAQLGIWLSPWGGYGKNQTERVSHAAEYGYELNDGRFALSGPVYYKNFHEKVIGLIQDQGITHFKFDGTGNADKLIKGSPFTSDFDAAIHLISDVRKANSNVYINLTTGTTPTPSWLFFADSIWRGGFDVDFYGVGSKTQQWITYRDTETYRSVVRENPLFPLNSLMLHGLIYAKQAEYLDKQTPQDFADQAWSFFATGTQLQELYVTPGLLSDTDWDTLAKAALWSKENKDILFDTHWVGGDPALAQIYGWAGWTAKKSILTLRNPSDQRQSFAIDLPSQLELPQGEPATFNVKQVYGHNASIPRRIDHGVMALLDPLQIIILELTPASYKN